MLMVQVLLHRNLRGTFASCVLLCEREEEAESGFDFLIQFNQLVWFMDSGLAVCLQDWAGAAGPVPDQNPDQSGRVVGHTKDPSFSLVIQTQVKWAARLHLLEQHSRGTGTRMRLAMETKHSRRTTMGRNHGEMLWAWLSTTPPMFTGMFRDQLGLDGFQEILTAYVAFATLVRFILFLLMRVT